MSGESRDGFPMIGAVVLFGGPRCGFAGGPKVPLKTKDGRTLVCLAQRGECRYNNRHYECGLNSERSWSLPQIEPHCDRRCPDRQEVADPKVDAEYTTRNRDWDPYGFTYYKCPSDACQYYVLGDQAHAHDAETCPQCSQPPVEPSDDWVDTVLVEQCAKRGWMMHPADDCDPVEKLNTTPATKAAIRARLARRTVARDK